MDLALITLLSTEDDQIVASTITIHGNELSLVKARECKTNSNIGYLGFCNG